LDLFYGDFIFDKIPLYSSELKKNEEVKSARGAAPNKRDKISTV